MKKSFLLLSALAIALFITSCDRKNNATEEETDVRTAEDITTNLDFDEASDADEDLAVSDRGGSCPTVTFSAPQGTWPQTMTVDYGDACTRPDGRVLKGKIIITQSDSTLRIMGATRQVTYESFYVDDVKVEGTKTLTNNGLNALGQFSLTKTVDKTLTYADGTSTHWEGNKTRTWVEGMNTPYNIFDDVWQITGTGNGTNRDGETIQFDITTPLEKRSICRWIGAGVVEWTKNGRTRTLDFGNGDCDRFGTLTLANGDSFTIRLRR